MSNAITERKEPCDQHSVQAVEAFWNLKEHLRCIKSALLEKVPLNLYYSLLLMEHMEHFME